LVGVVAVGLLNGGLAGWMGSIGRGCRVAVVGRPGVVCGRVGLAGMAVAWGLGWVELVERRGPGRWALRLVMGV
jgi:hypothetical protein